MKDNLNENNNVKYYCPIDMNLVMIAHQKILN